MIKNKRFFNLRELHMFDFHILFLLCWCTCVLCICWQYQPFCIVSSLLIDEKVIRVLVGCSFFTILKNGSENCIKYFVKIKWNVLRTFEMLAVAFGESAMRRTQVQSWYKRFKEGQEDVNDDARPCRPQHVNNRWKHCSREVNNFS